MPALLGALLAVVFWGVSFVATKAVLREIAPITLVFCRTALGTLLLCGLPALRGQRPWPARHALGALAWMGFLGVAMLLPPFLATGGPGDLGHLTTAGWTGVLFLGLACSGLGYLLWYAALERIEATRVAALLYLEPLVTLAAAVLLLGEPVGLATALGGALVLAGVSLVQRA